MPYVIDAYNAIFADKGLSRIAEERLERGRDALVALLRELARAGRTVVAVFDGAELAFPGPRRTTKDGVRVIFSEPKGTADAEIERIVASAPPAEHLPVPNLHPVSRSSRIPP